MPIIRIARRAARPRRAPARRRRVVLALLTMLGLGLMVPAAAPAYALSDGGLYLQTVDAALGDGQWQAAPGLHWGTPAMAADAAGVQVAATTTDGRLWDMSYDNATRSWTSSAITAPGVVS